MEQQKTRCEIEILINGSLELILPLNSLCKEVIMFNIQQLKISNKFLRLFSLNELKNLSIYQCGDGNLIFKNYFIF